MMSQAEHARSFFNRLRLPLIALVATAALFAFAACGTGDTGPQGLQGEPGSPGEPGNSGATGDAGEPGATIPTGSSGSTGETGTSGAAGLTSANAGATLIVPIIALNDSGQDGIARLTTSGLQTEVVIEINSGAADVAQPIHVHAGSCDTLGGVDYGLESVLNGFSSTIFDISLPALREGLSTINIHKSGSEASVYVSCGNLTVQSDVLTIAMGELNGSGQSGTATMVANGDSTDVAVVVTPGATGVAQPIHIHAGSCDTLGGVEYPLTAVWDGTSLTNVGATLQSLRDGAFAVNLHKSGAEASVYQPCGDVDEGAAAVAVSSGSGGSAPPPDLQSQIANFSLEDLTVAVGQTVIWETADNAPHTVTHRVTDSDPPSVDSEFRSSTLTQSGEYAHVFDTPGTFQYFYEIHPNMRATITVN